MNGTVSLADLKSGQSGNVLRVSGGWGVQRRLQALGIRPGATVTKVSAPFRPGAVVVAAGGGQAALGYGVARKVIVEVRP
jgi:ferrous iron transport protein A